MLHAEYFKDDYHAVHRSDLTHPHDALTYWRKYLKGCSRRVENNLSHAGRSMPNVEGDRRVVMREALKDSCLVFRFIVKVIIVNVASYGSVDRSESLKSWAGHLISDSPINTR